MFVPVRHRGFTLIELLVVISIIALLIGILLPALGAARTVARQMKSNTQMRGIHQGIFTFAQSNKGHYPGVDSRGQPLKGGSIGFKDWPNPKARFRTGTLGTAPDRRMAVMLEAGLFEPDYFVAPGDDARKVADSSIAPVNTVSVSAKNISYAMLEIGLRLTPDGKNISDWTGAPSTTWLPGPRGQEWQDTANSGAIMLCDRAINDKGVLANTPVGARNYDVGYHSIWTSVGEGWAGGVLRNDGSVAWSSSPIDFTTSYAGIVETEVGLFDNTLDVGSLARPRLVLGGSTPTLAKD